MRDQVMIDILNNYNNGGSGTKTGDPAASLPADVKVMHRILESMHRANEDMVGDVPDNRDLGVKKDKYDVLDRKSTIPKKDGDRTILSESDDPIEIKKQLLRDIKQLMGIIGRTNEVVQLQRIRYQIANVIKDF